MKGIIVSIDRIVIDFTDVHWDFFNEFHTRICHFYAVRMTIGDRGFQYRIKINTGEHFLYISYKLVFAPKTHKNTLRIEVYPKSLVYFRNWLKQIRDYASQVLFVRCDVAFDIPVPINDVFTMSTKGRKLRLFKGTHYYNGKHQRQEDGYCRVYDKKRELLERKQQEIKGERTRMEIVYAPKEKIPLASLIQYPPLFNSKYLCAVLTDVSQFAPKIKALVQEIQVGKQLPQDTTPYYRKRIQIQMNTQDMINLNELAAEQWEDAITIPCAVLGGMISKVPVAQ